MFCITNASNVCSFGTIMMLSCIKQLSRSHTPSENEIYCGVLFQTTCLFCCTTNRISVFKRKNRRLRFAMEIEFFGTRRTFYHSVS